MTVNERIKQYLSMGNLSMKDIKTSGDLSLNSYIFPETNKSELYKINVMHSFVNRIESNRICDKFDSANIDYIFFKGSVLAILLYDKPECRMAGDIDVYVREADFEQALSILESLGYRMCIPDASFEEHHISLENNKVIVELHKHIINPEMGIDETYLLKHIRILELSINNIKTFDITATILHLLFHLYMDTYLACAGLYHTLVNRTFPKASRFLYRAYEIALFSEKYFNKINWKDIEEDIAHQNLRIIFKKMIFDILQIFPNAFPQSLIETVYKISYIDDERDKIYTYLVDTDISISDNIDNLLCKYIDENWNKRQMNNLYKKSGESFSLVTGKNKIACDLSCSICIKSISEGLKIIFKVSNDDFCVSEIGDYNTLASDGVHLLLCGTEEYSYNSIFFFPKEIDGEIKVIVCDVFNYRNKVLDDDLINAKILKTENDYTITVILSNVFLEENHLSSYFYMGVVISDCSSETHSRKNALILSEETSQWYNPIYFAKVVIN